MNIKDIKVGQKLRLKWLTDEDVQDIDNSVGWVDGLDDYYGKVFRVIDIDDECDILKFALPNVFEDEFWLQPCYFENVEEEDEVGDCSINITLQDEDKEFLEYLLNNHSDLLDNKDKNGLIKNLYERVKGC